jgi:hypothetical protein
MPRGPAVPSSLASAYDLLEEGRAWVACLAVDDGVDVVCSKATVAGISEQGGEKFMSIDAHPIARMAFLISGVRAIEEEVLG